MTRIPSGTSSGLIRRGVNLAALPACSSSCATAPLRSVSNGFLGWSSTLSISSSGGFTGGQWRACRQSQPGNIGRVVAANALPTKFNTRAVARIPNRDITRSHIDNAVATIIGYGSIPVGAHSNDNCLAAPVFHHRGVVIPKPAGTHKCKGRFRCSRSGFAIWPRWRSTCVFGRNLDRFKQSKILLIGLSIRKLSLRLGSYSIWVCECGCSHYREGNNLLFHDKFQQSAVPY